MESGICESCCVEVRNWLDDSQVGARSFEFKCNNGSWVSEDKGEEQRAKEEEREVALNNGFHLMLSLDILVQDFSSCERLRPAL
jgi:hypothetical protein